MENLESDKNQEKNQKWQEILNRVQGLKDAHGKGIDSGIVETVVGLRANGLPTSSSCAGHREGGRFKFPYVHMEAPGEPEYRFIGQRELVEEIVKKYGLKPEEIEDGENEAATQEYFDRSDHFETHTEEYQVWLTKNQAVEEKLQELLDEYYGTHSTEDPDSKLVIGHSYPAFRLQSTEANKQRKNPLPSSEQVLSSQKEFKSFTEFLRKRYFNG